jgi:ABC-type amino acid transport substrate-binding protein
MGVLAAIAGVLFWLSNRELDAEEDALNELDAGKVNIYMDSSNTDRRSVAAVLQHLRGL